jgi:hypothetical protein
MARGQGRVMRFRGPLALAALALMGCAAVSVEGVRRTNDSHTLVEPIAVVIFQSSTPVSHSQPGAGVVVFAASWAVRAP